MKTILVTGGLGYIGSHICVSLLNSEYNVVIVDNLNNSEIQVFENILNISEKSKGKCKLHIFDLCSLEKCIELFKNVKIDTIIHCAGKKSVNESIHTPLIYYRDNITMTLNLLECIEQFDIKKFIFSSSATVYGTNCQTSEIECFDEKCVTGQNITSPYGKTKYMQEQIIQDFAINHMDKTFTILRYFNPVGSHHSGLIGDNPNTIPNNLIPYILRVTMNNMGFGYYDEVYSKLTIFGNDYDTPDGTCIRDFIHIMDLADVYIKVLDLNNETNNVWIFNVGTGKGTSVYELVETFKKVNNVILNFEYGEKREGDIPSIVCDSNYINNVLGWGTKRTLKDIVESSWKFIVNYDFKSE